MVTIIIMLHCGAQNQSQLPIGSGVCLNAQYSHGVRVANIALALAQLPNVSVMTKVGPHGTYSIGVALVLQHGHKLHRDKGIGKENWLVCLLQKEKLTHMQIKGPYFVGISTFIT